MTSESPLNEVDETHNLVGAYVLGALEEQEAEEFQRHLSTCTTCPDEIKQMQPALLGLESLLDDSAPGGLADQIVSQAPNSDAAPVLDIGSTANLPRTPTWARRASQLAVAAGVAIIALIAWNATRGADEDRIAEIASADDARVFTLSGELADVDLLVSDSLDAVAFADETFEDRGPGEFYALWIVETDGGPQFLGRVRPDDGGVVRQAWESAPDEATAFAVSVEVGEENPVTPSANVVLSGDSSEPAG